MMVTETATERTPLDPGIEGWAEPNRYRHNPYAISELDEVRTDIDDQAIARFKAGSVELAWRADSRLVLGLVWRFTSVTLVTWRGTIYCWWRDQKHWPPFEIRDPRLTPQDARLLRIRLLDARGQEHADRIVRMDEMFVFSMNSCVNRQSEANDWGHAYNDTSEQLKRQTPAEIAASVSREPPLGHQNWQRHQFCVCENIR